MSDLAGKFCARPFSYLNLGAADAAGNSQAWACCPKWLPLKIGTYSGGKLEEIWNSPAAQEIRRSILDGDFKYCDRANCPSIARGTLPDADEIREPELRDIIDSRRVVLERRKPKWVNLANDRSCNLSCPSCRDRPIQLGGGDAYALLREKTGELLRQLLPGLRQLIITGSGDPFASKLYRTILSELDASEYPDLSVVLLTNGVLLTPEMWERISKARPCIECIKVSVDAATEPTYREIRRGGDFETLLENLVFLGKVRAESGSLRRFQLDFVVQSGNFREMSRFVELGKKVGATRVYFQKILNWGTFTEAEFARKAVWMPEHPEHREFLAELANPVFGERFVDLGNCAPYRPSRSGRALGATPPTP